MGLIKGKNTKIELLVFKFLRQEEIYFQKHYGRIRGKPDIAIPRKKIAVLIDGDFWHGWKFHERKSKLNPYWLAKIEDNMRRDRKNVRFLRSRGWKVLRIWEHDLVPSKREKTLKKLVKFMSSD